QRARPVLHKGYNCYSPPEGCGGIYIRRDVVDELVASAALDRIAQLRRRVTYWHGEMKVTPMELAETLERHRADLQRAARDYYIEHVIDRAQFLAVRDDVDRVLGHEPKELFPLRVRDMLTR